MNSIAPANEEAHAERGRHRGYGAAEQDVRPAEDRDHRRAAGKAFVGGGGGERHEAEEKAELSRAARVEAGEVAAHDGHHRAAGAGPHGEALQRADTEGLLEG